MSYAVPVQPHRWPVFVFPTRNCNYRCSYCYTDSSPERSAQSFVIDRWEALLDQLSEADVPETRISGGEPLAIPAIELLCRAIVERGLSYTITTNGSLLRRHIGWLRRIPPETLWLSFHREYETVASFSTLVRYAAAQLPRVGMSVFGSDWHDEFASLGAARIKLLSQSNVGRAQSSSLSVDPPVPIVGDGVELRIESTARELGAASCVLRQRPLLSIDHDGKVYACCVTLGHAAARLGDLNRETFAAIVERGVSHQRALPCAALLPRIATGNEGCPIRLYAEL